MHIEFIARQGGLASSKVGGSNSWGPCPKCHAERRSRSDARLPLDLTNAAESGPLRGQAAWVCRVCDEGGSAEGLARLLGVELPDDYEPPPTPAPPEPTEGSLGDVDAGWDAVQRSRGVWRDRLQAWAVGQGWTAEIAQALVDSPHFAAVPDGAGLAAARSDVARLMRLVADHPRDVLIARRDVQGRVVDISRRWFPAEKPPKGEQKTKPCHRSLVGERLGLRFYGSIPAAVEKAERGEPIILIEGDRDFAIADAATRIRQHGAALGAPGANDLPQIASALCLALRKAGRNAVKPGTCTFYLVPDVGDHRGDPTNKGWFIGERKMWLAAVQLLEWGAVYWCPPVGPGETGDLIDYLPTCRDPVAGFWALLGKGQVVLDSGDTEDVNGWKTASDVELIGAARRLPLADLIEFIRWFECMDDKGRVRLQRGQRGRVPNRGRLSGETRLSRAVLAWMQVHGVRFVNTAGGTYVWDPLDTARRPPMRPGEYTEPPRNLPRLIRMESSKHWVGWLQEIGWLNKAVTEHKAIISALQAHAQRSPWAELASWMTAEGSLRRPVARLHLHTSREQLMVARPGEVTIEANGLGRRILLPSDEVEAPIEWLSGATAADAARLYFRLIGANMTISPIERALVGAWALLIPIRELVKDRPLLWGTGESGAGKSFLQSMLDALIYASGDPGTYTTAALWEMGPSEPYLAPDNKESAFIADDLLELLLTAVTGVKRRKRSQGDRGIESQRFRAMLHLTAIARPTREDLQRRTLLIHHTRRWSNDGWRPSAVITDIRRQRSALWSGLMRLMAEDVMPRLSAGEHGAFADRVPDVHPNAGMREALGVMAVISTALGEHEPAWNNHGDQVLGAWLQTAEERVQDIRAASDPLQLALDELLFHWNRVVTDRITGRAYRPAFTERPYRCLPVFRCQPRHARPGKPPLTADLNHAEQPPGGELPPVVGFCGESQELLRDLELATRHSSEFREAVPDRDVLTGRFGRVQGWESHLHRRPRGKPRQYLWVREAQDDSEEAPDG